MATKKTTKKKKATPAESIPEATAEGLIADLPPESSYVVLDGIVAHVDAPEFIYDLNQPVTLIPLVVAAWNGVRGHGDAPFESCVPDFRQSLLNRALNVLRTGNVVQGDTSFARFEQAVARLK